MEQHITKDNISKVEIRTEKYEIHDTELSGFIAVIRPSGTITYIVSYRWKGKRSRITLGKSKILTVPIARIRAKEILAGLALGQDPGDLTKAKKAPLKAPTLKSFIEDEYKIWLEAHRKTGKATIKRILFAFKCFLDDDLMTLKKQDIDKWQTRRLNAGKQPATINRDINALKSLLSKAKEWNKVEVNILFGMEELKVDKLVPGRYLSNDEKTRLMEAIVARENDMIEARVRNNERRKGRGWPLFPQVIEPLRYMYIVALHTGIRWGSLVALEWKDIDWEIGDLTALGESGKTGDTYHVPMNSVVISNLKAWQALNDDVSQGLIFPGKDGTIKNNVKKSWATVKKTAGIAKFRWHDLRHTFASWLVIAGVDLNTVRELMGHKDIKMTLRYIHLKPGHKAAAVAVLV